MHIKKNGYTIVSLLLAMLTVSSPVFGIMERGGWPWNVELRSYYDNDLGHRMWFLNLGPTGIRARIFPDNPDRFVVEHVFQDDKSPARGLVEEGDVIVGANGSQFSTNHRFGRRLGMRTGWDGPLLELAGHIEDSQGRDGVLTLMIRQQGDQSRIVNVDLQLEPVGRFAETFPYHCPRSERLLEELCDFIVRDYTEGNWKSENRFYGSTHGEAHQLLALMASGIEKYEPIIERHRRQFYNNTYNPATGGFRMWRWGYEAILMGEMYHLYDDRNLIEPMKSLAEAMPWGSFNRNGIYTHRSHINIRGRGGRPYASIAAISGLQMVGMSIFRHLGLHYEDDLYETIYQLYLRSARPDRMNIAYGFSGPPPSPLGRDERHAVIELKNPEEALSGKGPGYVVPHGMSNITEYEITWPHKDDHRWKPTDWVEDERDENIVEELEGNRRRVNRFLGEENTLPDPTRPYDTTATVDHVAASAIGGVAMLLGSPPREGWRYLGLHAARTSSIRAGAAFDGHAASNLHAFWSVLASIRTEDPEMKREYLDYMKTFLILSQTHDGNGLYLQPWGRDRPNANSDTSFGPRILPTATGVMLLSLPRRRLLITGADMDGSVPQSQRTGSLRGQTQSRLSQNGSSRPSWGQPPAWAQEQRESNQRSTQTRAARTLSDDNLARLERATIRTLHQLSSGNGFSPIPMQLSISSSNVILLEANEDGSLTLQSVKNQRTARVAWDYLTSNDHAVLAALIATMREDSSDAQALAGVYLEHAGSVRQADSFLEKANENSRNRFEALFE